VTTVTAVPSPPPCPADLLEHTRRAARIAAVRAEKSLHLASAYERRDRHGAGNTVLYLSEARRLREDALVHVMAGRRHAATVEALGARPGGAGV
jgi:hypothetical protein